MFLSALLDQKDSEAEKSNLSTPASNKIHISTTASSTPPRYFYKVSMFNGVDIG